MMDRSDAIPLRLTIRKGLSHLRTLPLDGSPLRIGRSPDVEIQLDHVSVSRHHAQIRMASDGWHIQDTGSTNGVLLNGERVMDAPLRPGDVIEIRPFTLQCQSPNLATTDQSIWLVDSSAVTQIGRATPTPAALVRQRLEDLYGLARLVLRRSENGTLWDTIQAALRRSLHAERCVIIGIDGGGDMYRLCPSATDSGRDEPLQVSQTVLRNVVDKREGVLVERVDAHAAFAQAMSLAGGGIGSVICVPVVIRQKVRAVFYADRHHSVEAFRSEDLSFVAAAVDLAAAAVEIDELHDQARELAHVRGRLAAAREIQEMLFPSPIPQPGWGRIAARNVPADIMSGDIFDVARGNDGSWLVMLADVAGKGVPASLVTAALQSTLRTSVGESGGMLGLVQRMNRAIEAHRREGLFATMVLARFSADGRNVEIANCGHHAPLWLDWQGCVHEFPERIGTALGIGEVWEGRVAEFDVREFRAMTLFSDGVTEARNSAGEELGTARAQEIFKSCDGADVDEAVRKFADQVNDYCKPLEPEDDITIVWTARNDR